MATAKLHKCDTADADSRSSFPQRRVEWPNYVGQSHLMMKRNRLNGIKIGV
jgi:hypothetical protein